MSENRNEQIAIKAIQSMAQQMVQINARLARIAEALETANERGMSDETWAPEDYRYGEDND